MSIEQQILDYLAKHGPSDLYAVTGGIKQCKQTVGTTLSRMVREKKLRRRKGDPVRLETFGGAKAKLKRLMEYYLPEVRKEE